ncbi:MAG: DUF1850 domain-containing protein [Parvibaculaceae bacterium]
MSLCIAAGAKLTLLAVSAFTLSWTHSVEKTRWEEDWRVTPAGLEIVEARVKGSGAGMDPPEGARLEDGWWRYRPDITPRSELALGASGATGEGWRVCAGGRCIDLDEKDAEGRAFILRPCRSSGS